MLNEIVDLVKQEISGRVTNNAQIPDEQKDDVAQTAVSAVVNELKNHFTPDNIPAVKNLLGGGDTTGNHISDSLQTSVVSALSEKLGIDQNTANNVASEIVPAVIGLFSKKVNDSSQPGFNVESLIDSFKDKEEGGILGMIGRLFGK